MYLLYCVKMYCSSTLSKTDNTLLVNPFKPFDFFQCTKYNIKCQQNYILNIQKRYFLFNKYLKQILVYSTYSEYLYYFEFRHNILYYN